MNPINSDLFLENDFGSSIVENLDPELMTILESQFDDCPKMDPEED
jgi:hypothetical protein